MTYDQIEKMDKEDLVYAFKRMVEIAEKAAEKLVEMEAKSANMGEDFCPYSHIGYCEASFSILVGNLDSVIHVVTNK
jgi:hypothetical protein